MKCVATAPETGRKVSGVAGANMSRLSWSLPTVITSSHPPWEWITVGTPTGHMGYHIAQGMGTL